MSLQDKYAALISTAKSKAVGELNVTEQDSVLYIDGKVSSSGDKEAIWQAYNQIDPDYRAGDVRLTIEVNEAPSTTTYTVKSGDNLSKIASQFGLKWKDIFEENKDIIKNPDLIQPGWNLKIPVKNSL